MNIIKMIQNPFLVGTVAITIAESDFEIFDPHSEIEAVITIRRKLNEHDTYEEVKFHGKGKGTSSDSEEMSKRLNHEFELLTFRNKRSKQMRDAFRKLKRPTTHHESD